MTSVPSREALIHRTKRGKLLSVGGCLCFSTSMEVLFISNWRLNIPSNSFIIFSHSSLLTAAYIWTQTKKKKQIFVHHYLFVVLSVLSGIRLLINLIKIISLSCSLIYSMGKTGGNLIAGHTRVTLCTSQWKRRL